MILNFFKVTEHSLSPEYQEGDFVLIVKFPLPSFHYKAGDVVVFNHPSFGKMIKRVQVVYPEKNTLFVTGSHPDSIDSRQFGPIAIQSVRGKVIWHIKKTSSR